MSSRTNRRREAGLTPVLVIMVLAALALLASLALTGALAIATSARGTAQHGADAAALAGAQAVLDQIPSDVRPGFLEPGEVPGLLGGVCSQTGSADATRLARANATQVTSYCYNAYRDEITVSVTTDNGAARAEATASTTFEADACSLDPDFDDGSGDGSGEPDDEADEPPQPQRTVLDCGITGLTVVFDPADARFRFVGLELLLADVKPRLTR